MSSYTIIDADTHVTETPDLWISRAPARMRDRVPRVETNAKGTPRWFEQMAPRRLIDKIGADNLLFETDFPQPTSLYGDEVQARIKSGLSGGGELARYKILWGNAQKLYKVTAPSAPDEVKRAAEAEA